VTKLRSPIFQRLADVVASGDDGGVEAVGKAFDLYRSCMDAATIESLGATPLLNLIQDRLGTMSN
jgi:predicted metalloendopeptidase